MLARSRSASVSIVALLLDLNGPAPDMLIGNIWVCIFVEIATYQIRRPGAPPRGRPLTFEIKLKLGSHVPRTRRRRDLRST